MCTGMTSFNRPEGWISVKDRLPEDGKMCQMKKRKFRALTIGEHCAYTKPRCRDCEYYGGLDCCNYSKFNKVQTGKEPYITKDGKYILIEVKE